MSAPGWLLLAPLAWLLLWLLERWRRQPLEVVVADLSLFAAPPGEAASPQARRRPSPAFWWRAAACGALAVGAAGPEWTQRGRLDVDLVCDRGLESGVTVDGTRVFDWQRAQLERVLARLEPRDRVHLSLVPSRGGVPPLSPADARRVLALTAPVAAQGDARRAAQALPGQRPAFVASPAPLELEGVVQARWTARGPNRGVVGLRVADAGVEVAVVGDGLPGPCAVELEVGAGGVTLTHTLEVELPVRGSALARWPRSAWPPDLAPERVEARLTAPDALALDDRGVALRAPRARVGLLSDPGPAVERALRAVPGTVVSRADLSDLGAYDLLVLDRLRGDAPLPPTAAVVVPRASEPAPPTLVRAAPDDAGAFTHTVDAVFAAPFSVRARSPLPALEGAHPLIQTVDGEPLVVVKGRGRELLAALGVPPLREATSWVDARAFPFFWAELVALATAERGQLAAVPAGTAVAGEPALEVGAFPPDAPRVGTVAAPLPRREAAPPVPFAAADLDALEAARPRTRQGWGGWWFLLAAALGALGLRPRPE